MYLVKSSIAAEPYPSFINPIKKVSKCLITIQTTKNNNICIEHKFTLIALG